MPNFAGVKVGVITFPGSNCDHDMEYALGTELGFHVERLWHKDRDLKGVDLVVLPGGFSYGDYLRSGAIARFSPIMDEVVAHAGRGGLVLGVCNGFQVLCEAGLLPGAHGEGNYTIDDAGLDALEDGDQILFRYCGPDGGIGDEFNPNGSIENIAGVCNAGGNVFGMMPHPERACCEARGNTDGRAMLAALSTAVAAV